MNKKAIIYCWLISFLILPALIAFTMPGEKESSSQIRFKIKNAGLTVEGIFENFKADIYYDKSNPSKSRFNGIIQVASINTGISLRDKDLKKEPYFDAVKYPEIKFVSTEIETLGTNKLRVTGNLTIKNTIRKIVMEVNIAHNAKTVFSSNLKLNRRDYNVGGYSWVLSDIVEVDLNIIN